MEEFNIIKQALDHAVKNSSLFNMNDIEILINSIKLVEAKLKEKEGE